MSRCSRWINTSPQGSIGAAGAPAYAVLDHGSINLATLRYRLRDVPIRVAEQSF